MNRKLGQVIKAALFALPLALPGVALAQSTTDTDNPPAQDTTNKGTLEQKDNTQGSSGMSSGSSTGTLDQTDKQNAGSPGNEAPGQPSQGAGGMGTGSQQGTSGTGDYTPPAGSLDKSGSSSTSDRNLGGDINKSDDTSNMNKESTGTESTNGKSQKKMNQTSKKSTTTIEKDTSSDSNK